MTNPASYDPAAAKELEKFLGNSAELSEAINSLEAAGHDFTLMQVEDQQGTADSDMLLVVDGETAWRKVFPLSVNGTQLVTAKQVVDELDALTTARNLQAVLLAYSQVAPIYIRHGAEPVLSEIEVNRILCGERASFYIGEQRFTLDTEGDLELHLLFWLDDVRDDEFDFPEGVGLSGTGSRYLEQVLAPIFAAAAQS